jgi:hypothetical protein
MSVIKNMHFANSFTRWHLVSNLDSSHHQATIQEFQLIQKLKTISWKSPPPPLTLKKYIKNVGKIYRGKINYKNSVEIPTGCSFVIEFIIPKFFEG